MRRLAVVLWSASYGGAETYALSLVRSLRRQGIDASVVLICRGGPLERRFEEEGIPYKIVNAKRGTELLFRPWRLARVLDDLGIDAVVLPSTGFLVLAARLGGFWGPIVAVEHGDVLQLGGLSKTQRLRQHLNRLLGAPFISKSVAVSDFIRAAVARLPHVSPIVTIPNGVDLERFVPSDRAPVGGPFRIGVAARLIPGKGLDTLIRALEMFRPDRTWECAVAGDGPERDRLEELARRHGLGERIRFLGWVGDMVSFWQSRDVGVVPSDDFVESFGMTALEAMACGIPVIASRNGGLSEVVRDGYCGALINPGDAAGIETALSLYARSPGLCRDHGAKARLHCEEAFDVRDRAMKYVTLLGWS